MLSLTPSRIPSSTEVTSSPYSRRSLAKVYLSLFPPERRQELFEAAGHQVKTIRHELGKRVKNQLRLVPELQFFIDDSMDYAGKIDELLKS